MKALQVFLLLVFIGIVFGRPSVDSIEKSATDMLRITTDLLLEVSEKSGIMGNSLRESNWVTIAKGVLSFILQVGSAILKLMNMLTGGTGGTTEKS